MTWWVAGSAVGGALIGAGASKSSAKTQANAQAQATAAEQGINNDNINLQREFFQRNVDLQAPAMEAGNLYRNKLMYLLGQGTGPDPANPDANWGRLSQSFDMGKFQHDDGYQFRQDEGMKGLTRGAAANGLLGSGKYLKDAMRFNQGIASDEYGKAYDRYNNDNTQLYNRYASIAGIGQQATNNVGSYGQAAASNIGNIMSQGANSLGQGIANGGAARAAGTMGAANAVSGAMGSGWNNYQNQQYINALQPRPSGGSSYAYDTSMGPSPNPSDYALGSEFDKYRVS